MPSARRRDFLALLRSDDVERRCIALSDYAGQYSQRQGGPSRYLAGLNDEVLAAAREVLAIAHDPARPLSAQAPVTASWICALDALGQLAGGAAAVPRIVEVLDAAYTNAITDEHGELEVVGVMALRHQLTDADEETCARVGARLGGFLTDERLEVEARMHLLGAVTDDTRVGQRRTVANLLRHPDPRMAMTAARTLLGDEEYDQEVRAAVAAQPPDPQRPAGMSWNPAMDVRRELAKRDALASARRLLAARVEPPYPVEEIWSALNLADLPARAALLTNTPVVLALIEAGYADQLVGVVDTVLEYPGQPEASATTGPRLADLIADENVPTSIRTLVARASSGRHASLGNEDALAAVLHHPDLGLAVAAAYAVVGKGYEDRVRAAVAEWPPPEDGTGRPAWIDDLATWTRQLLAQVDEHAEGRAVLEDLATGAPVDPVRLYCGLHTIAELRDETDFPRLFAAFDRTDLVAQLAGADAPDLADAWVTALCMPEYRSRPHHEDAASARLATLFTDARLPSPVRVRAIQPFQGAHPRDGQEEALTGLLDDPATPMDVSIAAAYALLGRDDHMPLVCRTAAEWPPDAPPPADKIRSCLSPVP